MDNFELECKINYSELIRLLKAFDYKQDSAETIADYLTECVDYTLDLSNYLWNVLPYFVHLFDDKNEVVDFLHDEGITSDDCTIYETSNGKFYVQLY